jgi:hypothetical protein
MSAMSRSRLIVKSHSPVRSGFSWALGVLLLIGALWLSFEYGRMQAGFNLLETVEKQQNQRQQIEELTALSDGLRQQLAVQEASRNIDQGAYKQVEEKLLDLQKKLADQQKDLSFYRGIMAPESQVEGLQIKEMILESLTDEKYFRVNLVLMQAVNHGRVVSGKVRISVDGVIDGEALSLEMSQLSPANSDNQAISFSFRYFQEFERELVLPDGFVAERINIEVIPSRRSSGAVRESFDWQPQSS